jgi:hypothetical protein
MVSKNRTVSKNIQRKIKMCDIKNGFKLCTCKGAIPKNTSYWRLKRFKGNDSIFSFIIGKVYIPEEISKNYHLISQNINQENCFDFDYQPHEGDRLEIHIFPNEFEHLNYVFSFEDNEWKIDYDYFLNNHKGYRSIHKGLIEFNQ